MDFLFINKIFNRKPSVSQTVSELKLQERTLDDTKRDLKLDVKHNKRKIDKVIAQGTEAARDGDSFGVREAGLELKRLKADSAFVMQRMNQIIKAEMLTRVSIQKLEWAAKSKDQNIFSGIQKVLMDKNVQELVQKSEITAEQFNHELDRAFEKEVGKLNDSTETMDTETTEEESLFRDLAQAQEAGDENTVRDINSKLSGDVSKLSDEDDKFKF